MANELDKSIEEMEAEVIAELEEGAHDAPKKGATASEPMKKKPSDGATGEEDIGGSTPSKVSPPTGASASKSSKEVSGDAQQKGEGAPEKMPKLKKVKEGYTDDEIRELCHTKDHDCATVVEHPEWGKGKPILNSHAMPDDNGNVEWYDVQFKHGIERKVYAKDMVIEAHNGHEAAMPKTKEGLYAAMNGMMKKMKKGEMEAMYAMMMKNPNDKMEGEHEDEKEKEKSEAIERRVKDINVNEHVDA